MITITVKYKDESNVLIKKVKDDSINSLSRAGGAVRLTARRSMRKRKGPSKVGTPPNTHTGGLKKSILYSVDARAGSVVIGPDATIVGDFARAHEFGGTYRGRKYDKRPFMGPALDKIKPRLPEFWGSSVRQ